MQKISSKKTFFYKRIFPALWFGIIGLMILAGVYSTLVEKKGPPPFVLIPPIIMLVLGNYIFKKLCFDLVDEVFDGGSFLLVKNDNKKDQIQFSNIKNINYSVMTNPPRVTLSLREPSLFGNEISFSPPTRIQFNIFQKNPLIDDLIERVDKARR